MIRAWRLAIVIGAAAALLVALVGRATQYAVIQHDGLAAIADSQQTDQIEIPARRGPLLDRRGRILACTLENPSLAVRLSSGTDRARVLAAASRANICTPERAREITAAKRAGFFWLRRDWVTAAILQSIPKELSQIERVPEMKRFYPSGEIAPQLLGKVGTDGHGLSGLESAQEKWLAGQSGRELQFVTGGGRPQNAPPAQTIREPRAGGGLVLTIDRQLQEVADHHLREGMARASASEGFAILMDPWTGAILALAQEPVTGVLQGGSRGAANLRLPCVMDQYEPGSVWKIVTFCAALESGIVAPSDTFFCYYGERRVHGCTIHDLHKMGNASAAEILINSSNIGTGLVAERCGWQVVCDMAQRFGFGQPTGIALGGETNGYLPHPLSPRWSERSLVTMAYGQEIACSGLQLVLAFAAIANGGHLLKPRLVHAELDEHGHVVRRFPPEVVRRVISAETAQTMTDLLRRAVTEGTGKAAEVEEFPPAGKTGTAQIVDPALGTYSADEHILSFAGFAPYTDPRCVCLVSLRSRTPAHAAEMAAPIFAAIMRDAGWLLAGDGWARETIGDSVASTVLIPDVRGLSAESARQAIHRAGLVPVLDGFGARVSSTDPAAYAAIEPGGTVRLCLDSEPARATVRMPDLAGVSLRRAAALLGESGLRMQVRGSGWVIAQTPAAGEELTPGSACLVEADAATSQARALAVARRDLDRCSE